MAIKFNYSCPVDIRVLATKNHLDSLKIPSLKISTYQIVTGLSEDYEKRQIYPLHSLKKGDSNFDTLSHSSSQIPSELDRFIPGNKNIK